MSDKELQCKSALHDEFDRLNHLTAKVIRLNESCEDNMKRLNAMMLELKGIVAMVRPMAKKNDWYGKELEYTITSPLPDHPPSLISTSYPNG